MKNFMKYQEIEIEKLVPHPANFPGREQKMEVEMLRSVEEHGVMVPLMVRELESGDFQILAGHRRFNAVQSLDQMVSHVPCVVRQMDDVEAVDFVVLENLQRSELDPMDEAYAVRLLMEQHGDSGEVAALLSRSAVWVKLRQGLMDLGEEAKECVREGALSLGAAAVILKVEQDERDRAEQLVLHPEFQLEPLNARQAEDVVTKAILEPAKARSKWENVRELVAWEVQNQFKDWYAGRVEGLNIQGARFDDIKLYESADFVDVEDCLPSSVLTEHAPKVTMPHLNEDEDPCNDTLRYLDLALRHGLAVVVIPATCAYGRLAVVSRKLIIEAERSRMEYAMQPWIADEVSKEIAKVCDDEQVEDPDEDEESDVLETADEPSQPVDALAKELEWFIEQSRETPMREKVDLGAAVNYVLGVSDDCPVGFENLCNEDMSQGARRHLLRTLCWCQGVDFWR